jgi:small subunit ribosomal protein S3
MGQKVHPTGIRLGIVKDHNSVWYADRKKYAKQLVTDIEVRAFIEKKLDNASVSRVVIERPAQTARITIHTARPGIVIGKKGEDVDKLRKVLAEKMGVPVHINIEEIRKPDLDARLVAQNVAQQLERRVMFRRAMKRVVQNAMRQGARGHQGAGQRSPRWCRDRAHRVVSRGARAPAHAARRYRLRHLRGGDDLRNPRREGLDLQG